MTAEAGSACDKVLLVQAELDGELDAAEAAALAAHTDACPICQAAAAQVSEARSLVRGVEYRGAPAALRQRVLGAVAGAAPRGSPIPQIRDLWGRVASFGLGAACAVGLAAMVLSPHQANLTEQTVAGHIRAMQPGHLADVISNDKHTVKPWFDGRLDFTPPVRELAADGFPLRGGRLDYLADRPVAALVYQRDKHVIDLFIWPSRVRAATEPESSRHKGYNVVHWAQDGMAFWAVSDVSLEQLVRFAERFSGTP